MAFRGFERDAFAFLHELGAEMNREWFAEHKARYERVWVAPMQALLEDVAAKIAKAYAPVKLAPPKIFRIYRDTRFAADKTPYKTHVAGRIATANDVTALYVHLALDEEYVGSGSYFFEDAGLARWRKLVAAERSGTEIAALVEKLREAGYRVGSHEEYKRVPRGFDADHPRADYLRMRGLTAQFPDIPAGLVHDKGLAAWAAKHAIKTAPLVQWLAKHVR